MLDMLSGDKGKSVKEYDILMSQDDDSGYEAVINAGYVNPEIPVEEKKQITGRKPLDEY